LELRVQERTAELTTAIEQLRDSEHRYRSVIEDQLEFIVRWSGDGVRTFVNNSYCAYCGATREELIGDSFMPSILEEDRNELRRKLAGVSAEEPVVVMDHRVTSPDGRLAWQHWTHRALFNQQGNLIEFQSVGCDISEHRRREEHERDRSLAIVQLRSLTDRERDVMRLVVAGDANKLIARKLDLSVKTIEKHRSSLMKKLHVRSVPELVRLALLADGSSDK
jgi:PAS domain S-box-containing protein